MSRTSQRVFERLEDRSLLSVTAGSLIDLGAIQLDPHEYSQQQILVRFREDAAATAQLKGQKLLQEANLWRVDLNPGTTVADALAAYRGNRDVIYAVPDYTVRIAASPNDPKYADGSLWGLHNTGQNSGTLDADIDAPEAWDLTTGSRVTVAVIDTGVDYNHPDLKANIWTNPGEIAGDGIDNDVNDYVDDIHGWDFYNNDNDPMDDHDHGTHVAGTIGAVGNNGVGVVGVNWNASIMALKFLSASGSGSTSGAIAALNYATRMRNTFVESRGTKGANVLVTNNSWGGGGYDEALKQAIDASGAAGMIFAAAAGNGDFLGRAIDNDASPHYPSSYTSENIVAVAASDRNDNLASFSNYGATSVDLAAPGVDILSTTRGSNYKTFSGTSMATPHVAGAAALVWSSDPYLTQSEVKDRLLWGTTYIGNEQYSKPTLTNGRLDAYDALAPDLAITVDAPAEVSTAESFTVSRTYRVSGSAVKSDFTIAYYQSNDATFGNDIPLGTETIYAASNHQPVGSYTGSSPTLSSIDTAGSYYILARIDDGSMVAEFNETSRRPYENNISNADAVTVTGPPTVSISDVTVSEGTGTTTPANFVISLSAAWDSDVTVNWQTRSGTATADVDYVSASGSVLIPAGQMSAPVTVTVNGDDTDESNETFFVDLVSSSVTISDSQGAATILDDDGPGPAIAINDLTITEGDSGATEAVFTVSLASATGNQVTVDYTTADGTATAGEDYTATSGTLTFLPGETTKTIAVPIQGDTTFELDETFYVNLVNSTNGSLTDSGADAQGVGSILNNDPQGDANEMYVWDMSWSETKKGRWIDIYVTIDINRDADADGVAEENGQDQPAASAAVDVELTYDKDGDGYDDGRWAGSGTTNSQGQVSFKLSKASSGQYRASVTNLTSSSGYFWDGSLDHENPSYYKTGSGEFSVGGLVTNVGGGGSAVPGSMAVASNARGATTQPPVMKQPSSPTPTQESDLSWVAVAHLAQNDGPGLEARSVAARSELVALDELFADELLLAGLLSSGVE